MLQLSFQQVALWGGGTGVVGARRGHDSPQQHPHSIPLQSNPPAKSTRLAAQGFKELQLLPEHRRGCPATSMRRRVTGTVKVEHAAWDEQASGVQFPGQVRPSA